MKMGPSGRDGPRQSYYNFGIVTVTNALPLQSTAPRPFTRQGQGRPSLHGADPVIPVAQPTFCLSLHASARLWLATARLWVASAIPEIRDTAGLSLYPGAVECSFFLECEVAGPWRYGSCRADVPSWRCAVRRFGAVPSEASVA